MLSPLRNRFGIPGVISVIALVFAMLGGAYAASENGGSNSATASAKKKAKKGPRGPRGPKGPAGPAGAQGPAGPQGPAGAKGDTGAQGAKGDKGDTGNTGNAGQSVTGAPIAAGGACGVGVTGVKYTLGSTSTNVCNGKNGENGETGFAEELPAGESLYGHWGVNPGGFSQASISFALTYPVASGPTLHFITAEEVGEETAPAQCAGSATAPTAAAGHLCVYESGAYSGAELPAPTYDEDFTSALGGLDSHGVVLWFQGNAGSLSGGTWAVTAPVAP